MKTRGSTLNPYATAYIPISKRDSEPENHSKSFPRGDYQVKSEQHDQVVCSTKSQFSPLSCYGEPSQTVNEVAEEQMVDEHFDMSLDYLKMEFSGLSEESLAEAYLLNKGDLEATVDMLLQLEFHGEEYSESLPDTLDIGDVSESGLSARCASMKLKNVPVAAESSSDSAGSSQVFV